MTYMHTRQGQISHMLQLASQDRAAAGDYFLNTLVQADNAETPDELRASFIEAIQDISKPYLNSMDRTPTNISEMLDTIPLDDVRHAIEPNLAGIVLDPM